MLPALTRRQELLIALMARPDAPDLPTRAHRYVYRAPIDRDALKIKMLLAWMTRREIESVTDGC